MTMDGRPETETQYVHVYYCQQTLTCIHSPGMIQLNDGSSGGPLVMMVRSSPPGIGKRSYPRPRIIHPPLTRTEQDRLTSLVQSPWLEEIKHKFNEGVTVHDKYSDTWERQSKGIPKAAIFQRKIAASGGIQTTDLQRSRLKLYQLSYRGCSAGWVQISHTSW